MSKNQPVRLLNLSLAVAVALSLAISLAAFAAAPVTAMPERDEIPARLPEGSPALQEFISHLPAAPDGKPAGLYVAGTMAFPIVQQPAGQPAFVSAQADVLTQFRLAADYGATGLLAHNTLAGAEFSKLELGQIAALVFTTGQTQYYRIIRVEKYAALDPGSPYSDFRAADGSRLSAAALFKQIYQGKDSSLVLQTCIAAEGNPSWGRLFIIAEPVTTIP
jgi:hypothetical protein